MYMYDRLTAMQQCSSLIPSPTPSFSSLAGDEKLGVGLGTRLAMFRTKVSCNIHEDLYGMNNLTTVYISAREP